MPRLARVAHIVRQTLTFCRDPGRPNPLRVSEVCGSVGDVYKGKIRNKNIRFRLEVKCEVELGNL